jgi:hypothetical protein
VTDGRKPLLVGCLPLHTFEGSHACKICEALIAELFVRGMVNVDVSSKETTAASLFDAATVVTSILAYTGCAYQQDVTLLQQSTVFAYAGDCAMLARDKIMTLAAAMRTVHQQLNAMRPGRLPPQ